MGAPATRKVHGVVLTRDAELGDYAVDAPDGREVQLVTAEMLLRNAQKDVTHE